MQPLVILDSSKMRHQRVSNHLPITHNLSGFCRSARCGTELATLCPSLVTGPRITRVGKRELFTEKRCPANCGSYGRVLRCHLLALAAHAKAGGGEGHRRQAAVAKQGEKEKARNG